MNDAPLRTIQPVVVPPQFYLWGPVASGFLALVPGFFAFIGSNMIAGAFEPVFGAGIVVYVISFALFMTVIAWMVFSGPGVTSYRIYRDRIEVEQGLLNRTQRTVLIGGVIDVRLSEGVLQRTRGAGTVTLVIRPLVAQGEGNLSHQTIRLANVPQPREVYDLICSLALGREWAKPGSRDDLS